MYPITGKQNNVSSTQNLLQRDIAANSRSRRYSLTPKGVTKSVKIVGGMAQLMLTSSSRDGGWPKRGSRFLNPSRKALTSSWLTCKEIFLNFAKWSNDGRLYISRQLPEPSKFPLSISNSSRFLATCRKLVRLTSQHDPGSVTRRIVNGTPTSFNFSYGGFLYLSARGSCYNFWAYFLKTTCIVSPDLSFSILNQFS